MTTHLQESLRLPTRLGRLHVRALGSGPATVLWPSMFVDGRTFDPLLPLLPGRRLIVVDGPGLGASEPLHRRSSIAEAADAAQDLLTGSQASALGVEGPVDWVGNAFGGHVGYELARRAGVLRSLAAVSAPTEPVPPALLRQIRLLGPLLRTVGPIGPVRSAILEALLTDGSTADPAIRTAVLDSVATPTRRSLSLALRSFIVDRADVTARLSEIEIPCLYVAGDDRGDWSPEAAGRAAALTPSATAVTVPGSRTLVPLEQPRALGRELLSFWARL
jgi:pimeloyl-ACP methyl ester carboxylesterase